jgi:hypothetical protein
MRRRALCHLLLQAFLFSLVSSPLLLAQDTSGVGRGTLGVLIITKEGMVLAADSRTTYGDGRHDDRAVKLFKLGNSGCMVAGKVVSPPAPRNFGFNLVEEIQSISRVPTFMDNPSIYEGVLESRLSTAIQKGVLDVPPADFFDDDQEIASVLIGGYELVKAGPPTTIPDRYLAHAYKVKYLSRREASIHGGGPVDIFNRVYSERVRNYSVLNVSDPGPFAIFTNGNDQLLKAMLLGRRSWPIVKIDRRIRDVDLKAIEDDPDLNSFLAMKNRGQVDSVSLAQAIKLADALIRENIRLAGDDLGIGGQVDIATITRQEGFQWVTGHDPASKLGLNAHP